jgi:carbonic anhydrase
MKDRQIRVRMRDDMIQASPLPTFLVDRHRHWREALGPEARARLAKLAREGQDPTTMIVACCDSRVMVGDLFGAEAGEIFVHRNIANLVPSYEADGVQRGTSATVEYAVKTLKVKHIIVMGHYGCGGVQGCLKQHGAPADDPSRSNSFVSRWLEILEPRVEPVLERHLGPDETLRALEHQAVLLSLENLMTFPFVSEAVTEGRLQLHGIWNYIHGGVLEYYDPERCAFTPL